MTTKTAPEISSQKSGKKSKHEVNASIKAKVSLMESGPTKGLKRKRDSLTMDASSMGKEKGAGSASGKRREKARLGDSSPTKAEGGTKKTGDSKEAEGAKKIVKEIALKAERDTKKRKANETKVGIADTVAKRAMVEEDNGTGMISDDIGKKAKTDKIRSPLAFKGDGAMSSDKSKLPSKQTEGVKRVKKSKYTPKALVQTPEPVLSSAKDTEPQSERLSDDGDIHLHGFSTEDDDSSDEEEVVDECSPLDVSRLPTIAKDDITVKRKLEKAKRQPTEDRGVLYLGRVPHGFYEDQMKSYFSQFGNVTRLRLSRSKKTGRSKHYGFIEFDSSSVAQIVADTMDNYLLMGHILRCKVIPKDEVHPELWVGANRKWRAVPKDRLTRVEHNKPRTEQEQEKAINRLIKRQNDRKRKLKEQGIKYDFDAVAYTKSKVGEA